MKVLIHACCADCLVKMVASLKNEDIEVTAYFYNPNIHPRAEYLSRLKAIQKIAEENKIKLVVADWSPREWFSKIPLGYAASPFEERETLKQNPSVLRTAPLDEMEPLKSKTRCDGCWELRLRKTFEYASKNNFEAVSTTLLTSHYQNKNKIEEIGKTLEKEYGIKFLIPKKVVKDLKTSGFYKQNYCGCCYSLVEAWGEKFKS